MSQPSLISRVHEKVKAAEAHYQSIESKCDAILAAQKRWHLSPVVVLLMVIGAFVLGGWLHSIFF